MMVVELLCTHRVQAGCRQENTREHAVSKTREGQGSAVAPRNAGERCNQQGGEKVEPRRSLAK